MYSVVFSYPPDDYRAAANQTVAEAQILRRSHLPVFAYGESAGDTLAEFLAETYFVGQLPRTSRHPAG